MATKGDSQKRDASQGQRIRAVTAASIGNFVEWYDFAIYGYLAVYIGQQFFPAANETTSLLASFAAFGTAFIFRPLGGFVLGPLADRVGRQKVLVLVIANVRNDFSHWDSPYLWDYWGIGSSPSCSCQVCPRILCRW